MHSTTPTGKKKQGLVLNIHKNEEQYYNILQV